MATAENEAQGTTSITSNSQHHATPPALSATSTTAPPTFVLLDAPVVDDYFIKIFVSQLQALFKDEHILKTLMDPLFRLFVLFSTRGDTPALRLLGLSFVRSKRMSQQPQNHPKRSHSYQPSHSRSTNSYASLIPYAMLSIVLPALYKLLEQKFVAARARQMDSEESTTTTTASTARQQLARQRHELVWKLLSKYVKHGALPILKLVSLLACWTRVVDTPNIAMLLSGWTYQSSTENATPLQKSSTNQVRLQVDFAHRRWLYEEIFQTVRVLGSGLALIRTWQPVLHDAMLQLSSSSSSSSPLVRWMNRIKRRFFFFVLPSSLDNAATSGRSTTTTAVCPICHERPIIAVQPNCSCRRRRRLYCYACLYHASSRNSNSVFHCMECGKPITEALTDTDGQVDG